MLLFFIKIIIQLLILICLNYFGIWLVEILNMPLPGNVVGMVILLVLLMTKVIKLEWIEETASFFNKHLGFFFIPICVGLMTVGNLFIKHGIPLVIVLFISAFIGIFISSFFAQRLIEKKVEKQYDHHVG